MKPVSAHTMLRADMIVTTTVGWELIKMKLKTRNKAVDAIVAEIDLNYKRMEEMKVMVEGLRTCETSDLMHEVEMIKYKAWDFDCAIDTVTDNLLDLYFPPSNPWD